ncbi:MAG: hypothetical protein AAFY20_21830 [Cyanobacteria bacterium J06639_14]
MTYTDLAAALARAKERSGATATDDEYLTELLGMSAGTDSASTLHYRPFFVAAKWLEQNQTQQTISKADGAEFTGLAKPIESLLALQASYDAANDLTIPDGFEAASLDCVKCSGAGSIRRGTRSLTPTVRP